MLKPWLRITTLKILKEIGVPDHLAYLLRNLYAGQKQELEPDLDNGLAQNWEKSMIRLYIVTPLT